jgi:predicted nucleotidyltransferase
MATSPHSPLAYWIQMRMTSQQQSTLTEAVRRRFGPTGRLWIFGSRVDDQARGGDFDIMVRCDDADANRLLDAKLNLLADLHATAAFEDERIDVVLFSQNLDPLPRAIHRAAMEHGVELPL